MEFPVTTEFRTGTLEFLERAWPPTQPDGWLRGDVLNATRFLREIEGPFDDQALQRAVDVLLRRHHVLSGRMRAGEGGPILEYSESRPIVRRIDLADDSLPGWIRMARRQIRPLPIDRALLADSLDSWMQYWDAHVRRGG